MRSFFPEVAEQVDEAAAAVFSAGNPDKFFTNYRTCMEFLTDFERELCTLEAVEAFRETAACKTFVGRWNLPIYFQIRYLPIILLRQKHQILLLYLFCK